jgi:preprotein translocase subunit SecA
MLDHLKETVTQRLAWLEVQLERVEQEQPPQVFPNVAPQQVGPGSSAQARPALPGRHGSVTAFPGGQPEGRSSIPAEWAKTPRNATCPCGSGKKFKQCHGKL